MSSALPLEVVEYVIDKARDDIPTLRSLSLTCHHLLPRSRYHLFWTVSFKNRTQLHGLCDFLGSKSHLRPLVHFVVVRAVPGVPHRLTLLEVIPVPLLSLLPNLRGWTLSTEELEHESQKWSSFSNRTLACLRYYSSPIRILRISSVHFHRCSEFARLLVAFKSLLDLTCADICFDREDDILEPLKRNLSSQLGNLNRLSLNDVGGHAQSLLAYSSYSFLRELDLDIALRPGGIPVTYIPPFSRLERITLAVTHAKTKRGDLHLSFSAVRSTMSFVNSATLKHLVMRLDYSCTPSMKDDNVLSECRELERLLLTRRNLETIVVSVVNARRHRGNVQSTVRAYHSFFPSLYQRGLLTVIPEVDTRTAGHDSPVTALAVSPDSRFVASSSDRTILIWDTQTRRAIREWPVEPEATYGTHILAFSPPMGAGAGHRLASCGGERGRLALWDVTQGRLLTVLAKHFKPITACVWSADGARLASGAEDGMVRVWDTETYAELYACDHRYTPICSVLLSPDGRGVVTGSAKGTLRVWDAVTGERRMTIAPSDLAITNVNAMVYHPDGVRVAVAAGPAGVRVAKLSPDAKRRWRPEEVLIPEGQAEPWTFEETPETIAFSQDGRLLLWASRNVSVSYGVLVKVWNACSGRLLSRLWICEHDDEPVGAVCFSPDGKLVAIAASRGQVRVWRTDERAKEPVKTFAEHSISVGDCWATQVAFSPDGATLASGAQDGSVFLRRVPGA